MVKIGLVGAGHLGKIHIRILRDCDFVELVGFHDFDPEVAQKVEEEFGVKSFESMESLINEVDIIDVVTPTQGHYEVAQMDMRNFKNV